MSVTWGVKVDQILICANPGAVLFKLARLASPVRWARQAVNANLAAVRLLTSRVP